MNHYDGFLNCISIHLAGPEFEERIRANEANNPKFNFLNPNDPYHAYYQHKKKEFHEGDQQGMFHISLSTATPYRICIK